MLLSSGCLLAQTLTCFPLCLQEESLRKKRQQLLDEDRQTELERDVRKAGPGRGLCCCWAAGSALELQFLESRLLLLNYPALGCFPQRRQSCSARTGVRIRSSGTCCALCASPVSPALGAFPALLGKWLRGCLVSPLGSCLSFPAAPGGEQEGARRPPRVRAAAASLSGGAAGPESRAGGPGRVVTDPKPEAAETHQVCERESSLVR